MRGETGDMRHEKKEKRIACPPKEGTEKKGIKLKQITYWFKDLKVE